MSFQIFQFYYRLRQHTNEAIAGQGLVEYALLLLFVVIVVVAVLILLGPQIGTLFSSTHLAIPTTRPNG
jgi:Flp pilus assembly pilin Flp